MFGLKKNPVALMPLSLSTLRGYNVHGFHADYRHFEGGHHENDQDISKKEAGDGN
jgi:hypothetical protein